MNFRTIKTIIAREYLNKVKKKSFLITTLLVPLLVAGATVGIVLVMMNTKEKMKTIAVVDQSGIVMPYLEDTETIDFVDCNGQEPDSIKTHLAASGYDGLLSISPLDSLNKTVYPDLISEKPFGMDLTDNISNRLDKAVEDYRIKSYQIEGLEQIMKDVKSDVKLRSLTISDSGEEKLSEAGVFSIVSMILGIIIFMFVTIYGASVMSAVIEEKSSRVVEVLVSSVKATELMFGKIIGIALVALTQFLLWIVLTFAIVSAASAFMGKDLFAGQNADPMAMVQDMGVDASQVEAMTASLEDSGELGAVLTTLRTMPLGKLAIAFVIYFIFGYMLYASLYAAIGSAVENEGDTQQLQLPVTIPLMVAYIIAIYAFKAPDSTIAFWGSLIPFTSPIVMIARLPFGVPTWELAVSIVALILTFGVCAWASAKIYKVGILMFGKKSTWKDLWKWLKQN